MHFVLQHCSLHIDLPLPFSVLLPMMLQILFKLLEAILEVPLIIAPLLDIKLDMIFYSLLELLLLLVNLLLVLVGLLAYLVEFVEILRGLLDDYGLFGDDGVFDLRVEFVPEVFEAFFYGVGVLSIWLGGVNRFNFIH